jgi:protein tyrosine/serine phosphatase
LACRTELSEDDPVKWINLDGAVNVRDLCELATTDGPVTAEGRLLRGDSLQELTPADVHRLVSEIGVTTVIDLRSPTEVASEGPGPLTRVGSVQHAYHSVLPEIGLGGDAAAGALVARREDEATARYPDDVRCGYYLGYLEERPDQVVAALRTIAESPGAALVNCASGKDRTGVIVALALTAVGVTRKAVIADYAATAERMDAIVGRLRASKTYGGDVDSIPPADRMPWPETMAAFLDQIDARYGGLPQWLSDHGFSQADLASLRAKLLEPA